MIGIAQWLERLAQDSKILDPGPSHAECPLLEWAPHIIPGRNRSNQPQV